MDESRNLFERDTQVYMGFVYMGLALQQAESKLLAAFRDRWHEMEVLDLGVDLRGGGPSAPNRRQ
jgi:hypothetical protein